MLSVSNENKIVGFALKMRTDRCIDCCEIIDFARYTQSSLFLQSSLIYMFNYHSKVTIIHSLSLDLKYISYDTKILREKVLELILRQCLMWNEWHLVDSPILAHFQLKLVLYDRYFKSKINECIIKTFE